MRYRLVLLECHVRVCDFHVTRVQTGVKESLLRLATEGGGVVSTHPHILLPRAARIEAVHLAGRTLLTGRCCGAVMRGFRQVMHPVKMVMICMGVSELGAEVLSRWNGQP